MNTLEQRCGYYDATNLPHGGPARAATPVQRRAAEDNDAGWDMRYDQHNPWVF